MAQVLEQSGAHFPEGDGGGMVDRPGARPAIGLDIGGTKTEILVLGAGGAKLHQRREATPRTYDDLLALVRTLVFDAERALGCVCTVGIGAPGSPNPATGLHRGSNLLAMNGRPFAADVCAAIGRPVRVGNDANCMTLSEAVDGAAADPANGVVFGVILGTGVGGGVVVQRRVVEGCQGIAGEWGHNPMPGEALDGPTDTPRCYCGRSACLELFLSGPALERRYRAASGRAGRADQLAEQASAGDAHAAEVLEGYTRALACALGTVVNLLDPHHVVLAGGVSNLPGLAERVQAALSAFVFSDTCRTRVVRARHGDSSGVRGAAWLGRATVAG